MKKTHLKILISSFLIFSIFCLLFSFFPGCGSRKAKVTITGGTIEGQALLPTGNEGIAMSPTPSYFSLILNGVKNLTSSRLIAQSTPPPAGFIALKNATISVSNITTTTNTDTNGWFSISGIPAGIYIVTATKTTASGTTILKSIAEVESGKTSKITIKPSTTVATEAYLDLKAQGKKDTEIDLSALLSDAEKDTANQQIVLDSAISSKNKSLNDINTSVVINMDEPPVISTSTTETKILPASLGNAGGVITIQAIVTDDHNNIESVIATITPPSGSGEQTTTKAMTKGEGNIYTTTFTAPGNTTTSNKTYSITITATDKAQHASTYPPTGTSFAFVVTKTVSALVITNINVEPKKSFDSDGGKITITCTISGGEVPYTATASIKPSVGQSAETSFSNCPSCSGEYTIPQNPNSSQITYSITIYAKDNLNTYISQAYSDQIVVAGKVPAPIISDFNPKKAEVGDDIVITGSNFGITQGTVKFYNNITATNCSSWTDQSITCKVPSGAGNGKISVTTSGGTAESSSDFTVFVPETCPASGFCVDIGDVSVNLGTQVVEIPISISNPPSPGIAAGMLRVTWDATKLSFNSYILASGITKQSDETTIAGEFKISFTTPAITTNATILNLKLNILITTQDIISINIDNTRSNTNFTLDNMQLVPQAQIIFKNGSGKVR